MNLGYFLRLMLFLGLTLPFIFTPAALADGGDGYKVPLDQGCRSHTWSDPGGKTPTGFEARATDGCHVVNWTGSIGQGPGGGVTTFRVFGNVDPWMSGYGGPGPEGGNYCQYRAVHEANLYFTNLFRVPNGTEVTVRYVCD